MAAPSPSSSFYAPFERLRQSVSTADAANFQSTTLQEVWEATREIERNHIQREWIRNMGSIEPFLTALQKYSGPIEVLCNGTPFLPWIWVSHIQFGLFKSLKILTLS